MSERSVMSYYIVLPHLNIRNANALSSPFTIGFPAMTSWLGAVHALQRKLNQVDFPGLKFNAVGVVCHHIDLQTIGDKFERSIVNMKTPLKSKPTKESPENTKPASFIAEPRCHLDVSLVVEWTIDDPDDRFAALNRDDLPQAIQNTLPMMKVASGDLLEFGQPRIETTHEEKDEKRLMRSLMPGYALKERRDLMLAAMNKHQDALDALLDGLAIKWRSEVDAKTGQGTMDWWAGTRGLDCPDSYWLSGRK